MLVRRSRALVKPNIAKASKLGRTLSDKVTPASKSDTESADAPPAVEPAECPDSSHAIEETSEIFNDTEENSPPIVNNSPPFVTDVQPVPADSDPDFEEQHFDPLAPERRIAHAPVDHSRLLSPKSNDKFYSDYYEPVLPRPRKKFSGDEQLDPKKMRMMDMIYWNPKKEKAMTRRHVETESIKSAVCEEKQPSIEKLNNSGSKSAAPQVVIGPDGRLVIDEKSLVIAETVTDDSVWETIDEDRVSRKVTSLSFRNRLWRKGTSWTEKETELFYEILRCTGPDFGLMHEFFPTRARNELKTKFNREERNNWEKLKEVMGKPALLDDDLYERAATLQKEIEEEALNKKFKKVKDVDAALKAKEKKDQERKERERIRKEKKEQTKLERREKAKLERAMKKELEKEMKEKTMKEMPFVEKPIKEKKKRKKPEEQEWDENTADLVEEAATLIRELERESAEREDDEEDDAEPGCSEEPVVEIRRSERTKKLSIKAQELLELTKKEMMWKEMHQRETNGEASEENLEGYDEESDDDSDSDDSDSSDDVFGTSSYCYRRRQAPRVIKTSDLLPRRNMEFEQPTASASETPSTSKEKKITISESSTETTGTSPVPDSVEQDDQPCSSKDVKVPDLYSTDQDDQTCASKDAGDGGDEPEPIGHSTVELNTSTTPPIDLHTPEQGGDVERVKRPEASKVTPSKPEKSGPPPARKRAFEKAKPNIKLKQSRTASQKVEETTSTAAPNSSDIEHEVPAANREEEMDTMGNVPDNDVTDSPEPQTKASKPREPQQVEEDLFKRTRPANRNKLKRPLRSRR